jgi:hypothetical protein
VHLIACISIGFHYVSNILVVAMAARAIVSGSFVCSYVKGYRQSSPVTGLDGLEGG